VLRDSTAAATAAAVLIVAGCGGGQKSSAPPASTSAKTKSGLHGLVPQPRPHKPSFVLTDTAGKPFSFAAATRDKLTYLYFGYTHCPDACPTTMGYLAAAFHEQPASVRHRIAIVFVTVDPRRDTARVLRTWLNHFDRSFVGLTGSQRAIDQAERAAGVPLAPPEKVKGKNYSVAHSTYLFPYSPDGIAHVVYIEGFHPSDYAHDMPLLLRYS
jgi:protein SCO1